MRIADVVLGLMLAFSVASLFIFHVSFMDSVRFQSDMITSFQSSGPSLLVPYLWKAIALLFFISSLSLVFSRFRQNLIIPAVASLSVILLGMVPQTFILSSFLLLAFFAGKLSGGRFSRFVGYAITLSVFVATIIYPAYYNAFVSSISDATTSLLYEKVSSLQSDISSQIQAYMNSLKQAYISNLQNSQIPNKDQIISQINTAFSVQQSGEVDKSEIRKAVVKIVDTPSMKKWFPVTNALGVHVLVSLLSGLSMLFEKMIPEKKFEG